MLTLFIKFTKKGFLAISLFFCLSNAFTQSDVMYIMSSGFIEQEINTASDIDSLIFIHPEEENNSNGLFLMKDGELLSSYVFGAEVDSIVFKAPLPTADRAENMLKGIYWMLNLSQQQADQCFFFVYEIASDDRIGGGGMNDMRVLAIGNLMNSGDDMLGFNWDVLYKGVFRANALISLIDDIPDFENEDHKNQIKGEALFMRAFYLSQLTALHGEIPLPTTNRFEPLPAASITEIYGRIASDLKEAIEIMPQHSYTAVENGRASRWAAQALMARVFLFYTGFYETTELPTAAEGTISKNQVIAWLEDCIANSGHLLASDFHELWAYTNSFTINDYDYIQDYMTETGKDLTYVSNFDNRNPESVFAMRFYTDASWDDRRARSNTLALFFGLRGLQNPSNTFPFAGGWGQGQSVSPKMVEDWISHNQDDPRLWASVLNIQEEIPNYRKGQWDFVLETEYSQKKCIGITGVTEDNWGAHSYVFNYSVLMYENQNSNQLSDMTDLVLIRFADVLLMLSELKEDATYMNQVRARADLPPVEYTLENLQLERRYELAFEGVRWNDMRRWGMQYAKDALETQEGVKVFNLDYESTNSAAHPDGYSGRYEATKGFFPIPLPAIEKSEGLLIQVPGWDSEDSIFRGWGN